MRRIAGLALVTALVVIVSAWGGDTRQRVELSYVGHGDDEIELQLTNHGPRPVYYFGWKDGVDLPLHRLEGNQAIRVSRFLEGCGVGHRMISPGETLNVSVWSVRFPPAVASSPMRLRFEYDKEMSLKRRVGWLPYPIYRLALKWLPNPPTGFAAVDVPAPPRVSK